MAITNAERKARYRDKHPERIAASARAYYAANKEKIAARVKAHRAANSEKYREKFAKWRSENLEHRSWYQREWQAKRREQNPALYLLEWARRRGRELGRECTITVDDITVPAVCPLLGMPISADANHWDYRLSLDRIDTTKGYIPGNVQVVSRRANRLKSDACGAELLMLAMNVLKAEGEISGD